MQAGVLRGGIQSNNGILEFTRGFPGSANGQPSARPMGYPAPSFLEDSQGYATAFEANSVGQASATYGGAPLGYSPYLAVGQQQQQQQQQHSVGGANAVGLAVGGGHLETAGVGLQSGETDFSFLGVMGGRQVGTLASSATSSAVPSVSSMASRVLHGQEPPPPPSQSPHVPGTPPSQSPHPQAPPPTAPLTGPHSFGSDKWNDEALITPEADLAAREKYGLMGTLKVIRMTDPDLNMLALGMDLTTLGLNLNSPECLYATFASPWSDTPARKDPEFYLPPCYYTSPPQLKTTHLSKFSLETLFYISFNMPRDTLQAYAAAELYNRGWKYHRELKTWFVLQQEEGQTRWVSFDPNTWEKHYDLQPVDVNCFLAEDDVRVKMPASGGVAAPPSPTTG